MRDYLFHLVATVCCMTLTASASPALADDEDVYPDDIAASEDAIVLGPISAWNINYGDESCRLSRLFGSEEDQHLLFFEQSAPSDGFGVTMAGSSLRRFRHAQSIELGMERGQPMGQQRIYKANFGAFGPAIVVSSHSLEHSTEALTASQNAGIDLVAAETVNRVVIKRSRRVLSFETGNMRAPMEALNSCTFSFLEEWGLNPELHRNYTPPRWTNELPVAQRLQEIYPRRAIRRGEQGVFRLRAIVEADGSMSACHIVNSTAQNELETSACAEMENAEFDPAIDSNGRPMRSFYATSISYRLN